MMKSERQAMPAPLRRGHITQLAFPMVAATGRESERLRRYPAKTQRRQGYADGREGL